MSPTQRSLKHLRDAGWFVQIVERWNPYAKRRVDLFGFGDIVAVKPEAKLTLVQTTTGDNMAARIAKAKGSPAPLIAWLVAGGALVVHGWRKIGPRGKRKTWQLREVLIQVADLTKGEARISD